MPLYTPRERYHAFASPIFKENLIHFAGNSYLQVLPGDAEIILVGEYVSDDEAVEITRDVVSDDITQAVGDDPVLDEFRVAEVDTYRGTYLALIFTGNMTDGTRKSSMDITLTRSQSLPMSVKSVTSNRVLHDMYMSGVNDSPGPEVRNSPTNQAQPVSPFSTGTGSAEIGLTRIIGGVRVASQSFYRGNWSFKRKPSIGLSADLNPFKHGQLIDLIKGPLNTKVYDIEHPHGSLGTEGPVKVKFYVTGTLTTGLQTTSQNVSATVEVGTPYVDGQSVSREVDELIVTT